MDPSDLTASPALSYCTGALTPYELYVGVGGAGCFVFVLFANWCIFRYHLVTVDLSPNHHEKCLPGSIF